MVSNKLNEPWQHLSMRRKSRNLAVAETIHHELQVNQEEAVADELES